jgi:hypothetical protein
LSPGERAAVGLVGTKVTSRRLGVGSRLVLVLNVNKHPFEQINYGTGGDVSDESVGDAAVPLEVRWHTDSYVELPIWEREAPASGR